MTRPCDSDVAARSTPPGSLIADLPSTANEAYYFGTWRQSGHYLWEPGMARSPRDRDLGPTLDSGRWQAQRARQGQAKVTNLDGWTVLSFPDYSVDSRGGSHSTFVLRGDHDFAAAVDLARQWFPQVFDRFEFEVVQADE